MEPLLMDNLKHQDKAGALSHLRGNAIDRVGVKGFIGIRHRDCYGRIISDWEYVENTVMELWRTEVLERAYRTEQASPTFYFIPVDLAGFTAIAAADTIASKGWSESTDYDEAARQQWSPAAAAVQSITNAASVATITVTSGFTCHALALVSENSTKGNTASGILVSASILAADKILAAAETLDMIYQYDI